MKPSLGRLSHASLQTVHNEQHIRVGLPGSPVLTRAVILHATQLYALLDDLILGEDDAMAAVAVKLWGDLQCIFALQTESKRLAQQL